MQTPAKELLTFGGTASRTGCIHDDSESTWPQQWQRPTIKVK
jgi:hypothetical protein